MDELALELIIIGFIIEIIIISALIVINKKEKRKNQEQEYDTTYEAEPKHETYQQYRLPYQRAKFLTDNEYLFYQRLKNYVYPFGLQILAKVRLADLVNVEKGINKSEWGRAFSKISSKHVDFAIADDMKITIIIELDDQSHNRYDRIQRDYFVDRVLSENGYWIVRTYGDMLPVQKALNTFGYNIEKLEHPEYYN